MIGYTVGSYKITEKIGEGGMGTVFKGVDVMLDREVAIKMLRPELDLNVLAFSVLVACGCGLLFGSSPLPTRSVQSPKYLNGTPPSCTASRFIMNSPVWPEAMRRPHASAPVLNCPSWAGIVRVDS